MHTPNKTPINKMLINLAFNLHNTTKSRIIPKTQAKIKKLIKLLNQSLFAYSLKLEYASADVPHNTRPSCKIIGILGRLGIVSRRKFGP